jgi:hypothetical protein
MVPIFRVLCPSTGSRVARQRGSPNCLERVEQFLGGRFASFGIGGVRHFPVRDEFVAQRALRAERQLVAGGFAVDREFRAARILRRMIGYRATEKAG